MFEETKKRSKVIALKEISVNKALEEQLTTLSNEEEKKALEIEISNLEQHIKSLKTQSEQMLFDLKEEINQAKEAWKLKKENERQQVQEEGYKVGFQKGEEAVLRKYETVLQEANDIVEMAKEDYHRTIEKHEPAIIALAIKAAEKILTKEIEHDEKYITSIIRKAMDELNDHANIAIYVCPTDYELVIKQKDELEQSIQDGETLSIYVDTKLNEGDCVIKHPFGQIDISLDSQLQQIKNALEEKLTENE